MQTKSVIITGASDGIGRSMALGFARRGYRIGLVARRAEKLAEVAALCLQAGAPQVESAPVDVTQSEAFRGALEKLDLQLGGAAIFVANAGSGETIPAREDGGVLAKSMVLLNVSAALDGLELMKARMAARGHGQLVGLSSVAGYRGLPGAAVYCATKAALKTYLEALSLETRSLGLRVTTISPGFIATAPNLKRAEHLPFMMPVDRASEIFVRGVVAGKRLIVAPWPFRFIVVLLKHCPDVIYRLAGRFYRF